MVLQEYLTLRKEEKLERGEGLISGQGEGGEGGLITRSILLFPSRWAYNQGAL